MRLYNGDCLEVMKHIPNKSVDITLTSPPYNRRRNDVYKYYDDNKDNYYEWSCDVITELMRVTKGNIYYNIQKTYYNKQDVFRLIGTYYDKICEIIVWEKSNPRPNCGGQITNAYEFILVFGENIKSNKIYTKNHITTSVAIMTKEHKAIMHLDTAEFIISNFSSAGDTVLDPFAGSFTTGVACQNLGREFIGIELDKEYFKLGRQRMEDNRKLW